MPGQCDMNASPLTCCIRLHCEFLHLESKAKQGARGRLCSGSEWLLDVFFNLVLSYLSINQQQQCLPQRVFENGTGGKKDFYPEKTIEMKMLYIYMYICVHLCM